MKNSLVILFAVIVAVTSAARLPSEDDSKLPLAKLEPVLKKIIDHIEKVKSENQSEDVYENEDVIDGVPEMYLRKEADEEYRQKPTNLKALLEKIEAVEKQQQAEVELSDNEDKEDSDVFLSYGLEKPLKITEVKKDEESENDEEEPEEETEDNKVPISYGVVEEPIEMAEDVDSDIQISYGLAEPIEALAIKKDLAKEKEEEDDDDDDDEEVIPIREVKEEEKESDDDEVQISFGLAEPIEAAAVRNLQEGADGEDDDDEENEDKPNIFNEKVMSEIIKSVIEKFAKVHNVKL